MNLINIRDRELYPENLTFTLEQVTINEIPKVVGSAAYEQHKYPSDVDVYEAVVVNMDRDAAVLFYVSQFKNIMQKIIVNDKLFYIDFKLGFDPRFDLNILKSGTDSLQRRKIALKYFDDQWIDESTYLKLYKADEQEFTQIIKRQRTLRWTPEEVIKGKKILPGNVYLPIDVAVQQDTLIKLDVITWIVNRYVSIEVFFNLQYKDPKTDQVYAFHPLPSYIEAILRDIEFYSTEEHYNPLKVIKRMWSLSRVTNCVDLLKELNPLLASDAAALNQVVSDIEAINLLLSKEPGNEKISDKILNKIFLEILGFQKRIVNHLFDIQYLASKFNKVYELYQEWKTSKNKNKSDSFDYQNLLDIINIIASILKIEIVEKSDKFLKRIDELNITCANPKFLNI